jgi:hypothetical protein
VLTLHVVSLAHQMVHVDEARRLTPREVVACNDAVGAVVKTHHVGEAVQV